MYLMDFLIQNGLQQEDAFIIIAFQLLHLNIPAGSSKKTEGLELNGTYQLLVHADYKLVGENTVIIKKKKEALSDAINKVGKCTQHYIHR
jgi:hypothetical protein